MTKRVFIIHGWDGYPEEGWFPRTKQQLEEKGFDVFVPQMPDADAPDIKKWVSFLKKQVGKADTDTYFICHSIGCQTVIRYLESVSEKIGGVIFVAGFFELKGLKTQEEQAIAKPWLETPIDLGKVKKTTNKFIALFSDNDPFVDVRNAKHFEEKLDAKTTIQHNKGHFSGGLDKCFELPFVVEELLKIAE